MSMSRVLFSCILCCIVAGAVVSCKQPTPWKVIRRQHDERRIILLPNSSSGDDVPKVISAARAFLTPRDEYWPEPESVTERDTHWVVEFTKAMIMPAIQEGKQIKPDGCWIRVEKKTFSCSIMPSR